MTDPIPAQKAPYQISLEAGKNYAWCACGRSKTQPFCDGAHKDTGITPVVFKAEESKDVWLCGCKHTHDKPFCDGTHSGI